jgi:hypothetical protein
MDFADSRLGLKTKILSFYDYHFMTKKGVYQVYDKFLEIWLRFFKKFISLHFEK